MQGRGIIAGMPLRDAMPQHYRLDPVHTRIAFQVSHAGFSNPIGSFARASGTLDFDPEDWSTTRVVVEVPVATLDLGDADWQGKILDRTFFDAKRYPTARFVSTRVERGDGNHARLTGDLTLHGVTKPVTVSLEFTGEGKDMKGNPLVGFEGTFTLSRKEFGITEMAGMLGDDVRLMVSLEAAKK